MKPSPDEPAGGGHVRGIDSLRFLAATWVVFSHVGFAPVFRGMDRSSPAGFMLNGLMGVLFSGPAAVVVFFVISGFCIHYPFASGRPFAFIPFFIRRYLRIAVPMAVAMALTEWCGIPANDFFFAVLWSLVAELMYYTVYPMLRGVILAGRLDWLIGAAFVLAFLIWAAGPHTAGFAVFGWKLNWLLCLPCWLLGVRLAQIWAARALVDATRPPPVLRWRLGVWAVSSTCAAMNFHSPVSFALSMNFFGLLVYFWLLRELPHFNRHARPQPVLEWGGAWSYSIYLCHMFLSALAVGMMGPPEPSSIPKWGLQLVVIMLGSFVFYLLVEKPSHLLARRASQMGGRLSRWLVRPSS